MVKRKRMVKRKKKVMLNKVKQEEGLRHIKEKPHLRLLTKIVLWNQCR
jgi:hypothetical protein